MPLTLTGNRPEPVAALEVFRTPRSVTVVGASANPAKWGYWIARGALAGRHRRPVHLVNQNRAQIAGRTSVASLREIDDELDLIVLCTPANTMPEVVSEALELGARGFIGITAGIDRALAIPGAEASLAASVRSAGARLVGPNCLGLYDAEAELRLAWGHFVPGALAIVSQSGQVGSELANLAAERGLGVSRFVSVGNQTDVGVEELLIDLVNDSRTQVVGLYAESFSDGQALVDALTTLRSAGKPTIVLAIGASAASRDAAQSHTGALTSPLDVVDAACRVAGVIRVETPAQLVDTADLLVKAPRPSGRGVAIFGDSGGQGAIAADVMTRHGLVVTELDEVRERVVPLLPPHASPHNPIDLAGAGERELDVYADLAEVLLTAGEVDAVVLTGYFGNYGVDISSLQEREFAVARRIAQAAARCGKPVVVHSMAPSSPTLDLLRELGVPTYDDIEDAASSLGAVVRMAQQSQRSREHVVPTVGQLQPGYWGARRLLGAAGIPFPPAHRVTSNEELAHAAAELSPPYVLKADWLVHKSEHKAVAVGLSDADEAASALSEMVDRLGDGVYVLEEMDSREDCIEMIVGGRWDLAFGPTVVVGAGGVEAELLADTVVELAPVDLETATDMVQRLRSSRLLSGWRGRPAVDTAALARAIVTMSRLVASRRDCREIEVNPLRVGPDGVRAVDALVLGHANRQ